MFATRYEPVGVDIEQVNETANEVVQDVLESEDNSKKRKLESDVEESDEGDEEEEFSLDEDKSSEDELEEEMEVDDDEEMDDEIQEQATDELVPTKHSSILKRFQKSVNRSVDEEVEEIQENEETQDLAPLPQPELPHDTRLSSLSSLNSNLDWLTKPIYYQTDITKNLNELSPTVNPKLVDNLKRNFEIETAFSVQVSVIETVLKDVEKNTISPNFQGDLLLNASTGSGKTLLYCIPVVQALMDRVVPRLRCIILVPTKPLIQQVRTTLFNLCKGIDLNIMSFKNDMSIKDELNKYKTINPDIIISTPGRLVEHLPDLDLTYLRFLVIDEADRLLNQSFQNWCNLLISKLEKEQSSQQGWSLKCSKLIFSATLTTNSEKLSHLHLLKPRLIIINDHNELVNELYQLPPRIKECYVRLNTGLSFYKPLILFKFLNDYQNEDDQGNKFKFNKNILIFTKSNESCLRLTSLLQKIGSKYGKDLRICGINSNMKLQERTNNLKKFERNEIDILISTDLMSRGINLMNIQCVLNYDLPLSSKEYIHRIGRTARANNFGMSVSFIFGLGEWKFISKKCLFNKVINRNGKEVHKINVLRRTSEIAEDKEPGFQLEIEEFEKKIYEDCLKSLESEVFGN